jgi:hypothetical protein
MWIEPDEEEFITPSSISANVDGAWPCGVRGCDATMIADTESLQIFRKLSSAGSSIRHRTPDGCETGPVRISNHVAAY